MAGTIGTVALGLAFCLFSAAPASAQALAHRLILKDGSYQSITKYEIHGERVRYFSAERGEWEEVPKSFVDWVATEKYEQDRLHGEPAPEAVALDKELEAEQKAEEARSPEVAPGLRLPSEGGVYLLDTFQNQPQLDELQQSGGELKRNMKKNILRAAINPLASAKQTIELPSEHAQIQAHTDVPSVYINIDSGTDATGATPGAKAEPPPLPPSERFKILRGELKSGKRIVGGIKVAPYGKVKAEEQFVPTTVTALSGGWVMISPKEPLPNGEYALAEMLGKEGMNLYVWDFGVNPSAAANPFAWKPDTKATQQKPDQPKDIQKREKQ